MWLQAREQDAQEYAKLLLNIQTQSAGCMHHALPRLARTALALLIAAMLQGFGARQRCRPPLALQGIRTTHQEFMYGDGTAGARATEVFTSLQSGATGQDCNGHGTHVAAVVAGLTLGVAKNATLLSVRSLECMGNGTVSQVRGLPIRLACMEHYLSPIASCQRVVAAAAIADFNVQSHCAN